MNQCACVCHLMQPIPMSTYHCCECWKFKSTSSTSFYFPPLPQAERHDDIVAKRIIELEQKLEAQQKEIYRLKEIYWEMSNEIAGLKQQRDIGMERIKKLEDEVRNPNPNLLKYFGDSIELGLARKSIPEIVDRMDKLESKLAQQDSVVDLSPIEKTILLSARHCIHDISLADYCHECAHKSSPKKKTKTLWIGVRNKPFDYAEDLKKSWYVTNACEDKEELIGLLDIQIIEIEIEVPE